MNNWLESTINFKKQSKKVNPKKNIFNNNTDYYENVKKS